jgi:hypothetical protein
MAPWQGTYKCPKICVALQGNLVGTGIVELEVFLQKVGWLGVIQLFITQRSSKGPYRTEASYRSSKL